ncbi:MAG: PHP domain-containing protein [Motiliproteus sp.]
MLPAIDLHSHTTASDGGLSPAALVQMAAAKGLQYLAITDHDTCAGLDEARAAAQPLGVGVVAGIELSTTWANSGIHVVGLGIDDKHPAMLEAVAEQADARALRSVEIDQQLEQRGMPGVMVRARQFASGESLGRPHFARAMVELGYVDSEPEAFDRFLGSKRPGDVRCHWPSMAKVVGWIVAAGGIAVIAHPLKYDLNWTRLRLMLADFVAAGGGGLEVSYGGENPNRVIDLVRLAQHFKLKMSVGSDFHRPEFHWTALGKYPPLKGDFDPIWSALGIELQPRAGSAEPA